MPSPTPTYPEVLQAANAIVRTLRGLGLNSCIFGGLACHLYGNTRSPNDVDIVVLNSTLPQEELKRLIVSADPSFYLVRSKDPFASYKVLWYRIAYRKSCKVDILQPGIMNIPSISTERIEYISNLPVMPFSLNLLMKLQGWEDHKSASKHHLISKQYMDVEDLRRMLPIAVTRGVRPLSETWIPVDFIQEAHRRVKDYIKHYESSEQHWEDLGFEVHDKPDPNLDDSASLYQINTALLGLTI